MQTDNMMPGQKDMIEWGWSIAKEFRDLDFDQIMLTLVARGAVKGKTARGHDFSSYTAEGDVVIRISKSR